MATANLSTDTIRNLACPTCRAAQNDPCVRGYKTMRTHHAARVNAALSALAPSSVACGAHVATLLGVETHACYQVRDGSGAIVGSITVRLDTSFWPVTARREFTTRGGASIREAGFWTVAEAVAAFGA